LLVVVVLATALMIVANLTPGLPAWWPAAPQAATAANPTSSSILGGTGTYQLRMADNFSGAGSSLAQGDQPGQWRIELLPASSLYRMEVWPNRIAWSLLGMTELGPHRLQTNSMVASHTTWGYVGLIDRYQNENNFYLFVVDGQGRYQIQMHKDGVLTTQQDWTSASYINPAGSANLLTIEDDGQRLRFYANQMLLHEIAAPELPPGDVGLTGGALSPGVADIHFDWFQLYDLLPASTAGP
jgi:hypothetical protein